MKKSILIIEDNNDIRESTAELLALEGFIVITAENGSKGLKLAQVHLPDLVICDIVMPGMDGYEVLKSLRKNKLTELIPFVFSTAQSQQTDLQKATFLGVDKYLVKPYDEQELMNCIKNCLQK